MDGATAQGSSAGAGRGSEGRRGGGHMQIDLLYNGLRAETQITTPHQDVYEHATPVHNI